MADDATVKFGYDGKALDAGLNAQERRMAQSAGRIESTWSRMGKGLSRGLESVFSLPAAAAAVGVTSIVAYGKATLETYDTVASESKKLNTSAETLQRLGHAAEILGNTDLPTVSKAILKLRRQLIDDPTGDMAQGLEEIGLKAQDLLRLDADEQMLTLADAFGKASQNGTALPLLTEAMGKGFAELIPLLSGGREELQKFMDEAVVMSNAAVSAADELNDRFDVMTGKVAFVGQGLALGLAQGLAEAADDLGNFTGLFKLKIPRTEIDHDGSKAAAADAARDKENQAKRDAEADASAAKKAADTEKISAKKKEEELKRIGAAQERLADAKQKAAEQEMNTDEKIADVKKRLESPADAKLDAEKQLEFETQRIELQMKLNGLLKDQKTEIQAAADKEKSLAKEQDDREKATLKAHEDRIRRQKEIDQSRDDGMGDLETKRLRARGNDKGADKLERNKRIADVTAYWREMGASEEFAKKKAQESVRLDEQIERRRNGEAARIGGVREKRTMSTFHGLDQFDRMQEKEYESTDPARPGYARGRPRPLYNAFEGGGSTSAQRSGRFMGGWGFSGARSHGETEVYKNAKAHTASGMTADLGSKMDQTNQSLFNIDRGING